MAHSGFEFGLFTHIEQTSGSARLDALYEEHLVFLTEAEQAGFWGFHLAEHQCTALSMTPSPSLFLAAAAQRTKRMRLGAMVYLLPFYNPLRFAYEICMLDGLTGGRLEIGVGRGISAFEHAYYGIPILETREMYDDGLAAILKGLTQERLQHHGPYYRFTDVPMSMKPLQKPYPGLWYGILTPSSAAYAGQNRLNAMTIGPTEHAAHVLEQYLEARKAERPDALNKHVATPRYGATRWLFIADTDAEADRTARAAYDCFVANIQQLWAAWSVRDLRIGHPYDMVTKAGFVVVGSPAAVRDELAKQVEQLPANYMLLNMKWGNLTAAQSRRSLELFATEVRPGLKRAMA